MSHLPPPIPGGSDVPPVLARELAPPSRQAVWPTVVGVISIVFGALFALQSLGGLVVPFMIPIMDSVFSQVPKGATLPFNPFTTMREYVWWLFGAYLVVGLLAVALLTGGIALLRRRPWSAAYMRTWAVMTIAFAIGLGVLMAMFQSALMEQALKQAAAMSKSGGAPPPPPQFAAVMGVISGVIVAVMMSILPTFILIWFALRGVRADVRSWQPIDPPEAVPA